MRILLVDQSKKRMAVLRRAIASRLPDVETTEYDAEQRGKPPQGFDWTLYDAVLFNEDLGNGESALRWLREYKAQPGFPPAVVIAELGNTAMIAGAKWAGADAVIAKADLNASNLVAAIKAAIAQGAPQGGERVGHAPDDAPHLIKELQSKEPKTLQRPQSEYRGLRLIGQGGMSRVYLAERLEDQRMVVLKIVEMASAEPEQLQRFIHEAKLISSIDSPYVVKIFEHAFTNKYGFIAMEFFSRGDLKQRMEQGITPQDAVLYLLEIAYALEAIHAVGIVHRDLKPANIMFRADDSLALADFGVSMRTDMATELTAPGTLVGTLYYMSPEQVSARPVDSRTDLYSLGVLLFEMLMERKPFVGRSPKQLIDQHLHKEIPRLPPKYGSIQPVLNRLLAKDVEDRYQSASELIAHLLPACRSIRSRQTASR